MIHEVQQGTVIQKPMIENAVSIKGNFSWGFEDKDLVDAKEESDMTAQEKEEKKLKDAEVALTAPKALREYITLQELDL